MKLFQSHYLSRFAVLLVLGIVYLVGARHYRAYDIDMPWFLSFSFNYCHGGVQTDLFRRVPYPNGMDGVLLFGKMAARSQCLVLNRLGWTQTAVAEMNVVVCLVSLWLWSSFLRRLGYSEKWTVGFILLLGMLEPMVSMVEKSRYEIFAFFLLSTALWLAVRGVEFGAVLVAMLSVETEPAAIMSVLMVCLLLTLKTNKRPLLFAKVFTAAAIVSIFYLQLHPSAIHVITTSSSVAGEFHRGGILATYFIERKRHLPELALLLIGGWLYWKHRREFADHTPAFLGLSAAAALLLATHVNVSYMVFGLPFMLWPALEAYDRIKALRLVLVTMLALLMAQYIYLYRVNMNEGFDSQDLAEVTQAINQVAGEQKMAPSDVQIAGDSSLWYAHPAHYYAPAAGDASMLSAANLYLCLDQPLMHNGLSPDDSMYCPEMKRDVSLHEVTALSLRGHRVHLLIR